MKLRILFFLYVPFLARYGVSGIHTPVDCPPTISPYPTETGAPSPSPSTVPSQSMAPTITGDPTTTPSVAPTITPKPTSFPTDSPAPSPSPSDIPTGEPSTGPSSEPSGIPSDTPSNTPSYGPSSWPSDFPSRTPSFSPSVNPSSIPSLSPTLSSIPSDTPSLIPSDTPSLLPSSRPSQAPSVSPSFVPSDIPSLTPSRAPSAVPSTEPSHAPTGSPSLAPSGFPSSSSAPSPVPSTVPSSTPSLSISPSLQPSASFQPSSSSQFPTLGVVSPTLDFRVEDPNSLMPSLSDPTIERHVAEGMVTIRNITRPMDSETIAVFEEVAVRFLIDHVGGVVDGGGFRFLYVQVTNQSIASIKTSRLLRERNHVIDLDVAFLAGADVNQDATTEFQWVVETIFEMNLVDFFRRLERASSFFEASDIQVSPPETQEAGDQEIEVQDSSDFFNTWVIGCLAAVGLSIFVIAGLVARATRRKARRELAQSIARSSALSSSDEDDYCSRYSISNVHSGESLGTKSRFNIGATTRSSEVGEIQNIRSYGSAKRMVGTRTCCSHRWLCIDIVDSHRMKLSYNFSCRRGGILKVLRLSQ
jgi:hypothetical protein